MAVPDLFVIVDYYIEGLFAPEDEALKAARASSSAASLPQIQVSANQGKFLYLLAKMIGARRILEIGTLGGYSTIWLARALPEGGRLVTLEASLKHAKVAEANVIRAGLADRVAIGVGPALDVLPGVIDRADAPFDLVFIDADKENYPNYLTQVMRGVRSGSLIVADNVIKQGVVLAPPAEHSPAVAMRAFNAMVAADERLEAVILQQVGAKGHDGVAIARVK